MIGFGCILGGHLGSGDIIGWKGPPALLDRWYCFSVSVFLSMFVFSFVRDDDDTIPFYVFSWEPSCYRVIKAAPC